MKKNRIKPRDSRNLFFRDGVWWVDIQIAGKRYREIAGPTEARARNYRDKLRSWKRDTDLGLPATKPEGAPVIFEALAADYLELYARRKRSYERDVRSVERLKAFFKGWPVKTINGKAVEQYRANRKGVSPATRNREIACLRGILRWAVASGDIQAYTLPTKKLLEKEPEFRPRILEPAEARRILEMAEPRYLRPAVIVWLNTGLRKMELLKLRREDVDFKRKTLTVTAANAKNGKQRVIPINALVINTLVALPASAAYFFESPGTGTHKADLLERFHAAVTKAGITGRVRIHDLRDTFATQALRGGVDLRTVAEIIGDDPATALKKYCHTDERTMRLAVDRMPDLVLGSRPILHEGAVGGMVPASESIS